MPTLKPVADWLVTRPVRHKIKSEAGLVTPVGGKTRDQCPCSRVVAVGPEVKRCAVGDLVVVKGVAGEVVVDGEFLMLVLDDHVQGVLEGEDPDSLCEGVSQEEEKQARETAALAKKLTQGVC